MEERSRDPQVAQGSGRELAMKSKGRISHSKTDLEEVTTPRGKKIDHPF